MKEVEQHPLECVFGASRETSEERALWYKPRMLRSIKRGEIRTPHFKCVGNIIGASDRVEISLRGKVLYTEVLACFDFVKVLQASPPVFYRLAAEPSFTFDLPEEAGVTVHGEVRTHAPVASCTSFAKRINYNGERSIRIVKEFPYKGKKPRTIVGITWYTRGGKTYFVVKTLHEYYHDDTGLFTPLTSVTHVTIDHRKMVSFA